VKGLAYIVLPKFKKQRSLINNTNWVIKGLAYIVLPKFKNKERRRRHERKGGKKKGAKIMQTSKTNKSM
jgi:hypothetical protein